MSKSLPNSQLCSAISEPRFLKYLVACGGERRRALKLYRANLILSQKLYAVIGMFEIILRNTIDRYYRLRFGENWMLNAAQSEGFLDTPGCEDTYHSIQEVFYSLKESYCPNAMVSGLTLGFWTRQFSSKVFSAAGSILLGIFPNRQFGTKQKDVYKNLIRIKEIRNRIAHYEPLCFDTETGQISTAYAQKRYYLVIEMLIWLDCQPKKILYGIDGVTKAINLVKGI